MTAANGSGRRRERLGFALARLVGRTSPSRHAVRSPERNSSSVGEVGFGVSLRAGLSAISTSCCWTARISFSRRTVSRGFHILFAVQQRAAFDFRMFALKHKRELLACLLSVSTSSEPLPLAPHFRQRSCRSSDIRRV